MTVLSEGGENGESSGAEGLSQAVVEPLCVRFANTVSHHASQRPFEELVSYDVLLRWGQREGMITPAEVETLLRQAEKRPQAARAALARAIALREAIYRLFVARIHDHSIATSDLETLNEALGCAPSGRRLTLADGAIAWDWAEPKLDLWPRVEVAWSAAETLTSVQGERVGQCADERGCGWLFLDTSRNRSRRWCSMGDCGNRAKQRRHTARHATRADD